MVKSDFRGGEMDRNEQNSSPSKNSFYYGYRIVLAGAALVFFGSVIRNLVNAGIMISNKSDTAQYLIFFYAIVFLVPLAAGPLIDRFGPRLFILLGVVLTGMGVISSKFGQSLGFLSPFWILISIGYGAGFSLPIYTATSQWFIRRRAFFLAVVAASAYAGWSLYQLPALKGWAGKVPFLNNNPLWLGVSILVIGIPLALFFKPRPDRHGVVPEGMGISSEKEGKQWITKDRPYGERFFKFRQSSRNKTFWRLTAALALGYGAVFTGQFFSGISIARSGLAQRPPGIPVGLKSLILIVVILIFGYLGDKFPKRYLLAFIVTVQSVSVVLVIATKSLTLMSIQNIIFNFQLALAPLLFALCADYFGRRALATHYVFVLFLANLVSGALPSVSTFFPKSPIIVPAAVIVIGLASAVLFLLAKPPQAGAEKAA